MSPDAIKNYLHQIDYLISRKHPTAYTLKRPHIQGNKLNVRTKDQVDTLRQKVASYRAELAKKSAEEIESQYKAELVREIEEKEAIQFFNRSESEADFDYWSKMPHWTLDEAIALSFGKNPAIVNWKRLESTKIYYASPFINEYIKIRELALRAVTWKKLFDPILPSLFIKWAEQTEISFPSTLAEKVKDRQGAMIDWKKMYDDLLEKNNTNVTTANELLSEKNSAIKKLIDERNSLQLRCDTLEGHKTEKPLHTKEKETLLKMVIGMAVDGYGFDPIALRSPIPTQIADVLDEQGMPTDTDTVRKWLKEASELLPGKIQKS